MVQNVRNTENKNIIHKFTSYFLNSSQDLTDHLRVNGLLPDARQVYPVTYSFYNLSWFI
jgi:hypothetical protein